MESDDFGFELVGLGSVKWIEPIDLDETEDLEIEIKNNRSGKLNSAMGCLAQMLEIGDLGSGEAMAQMKEKGFSTATIRRAKQELGVNQSAWQASPGHGTCRVKMY